MPPDTWDAGCRTLTASGSALRRAYGGARPGLVARCTLGLQLTSRDATDNKEIFDDLGLSIPKTESEFFAVLEKIKSDGNYIPLAIGTADTWAISTMGFQNIGPNYWEGEKGRKGILSWSLSVNLCLIGISGLN